MKQAAPEFKISKKAIGIVNELLVETYTRVLQESRDLMQFGKKQTLSSRDCESAVKLIIKGELGK